AMPDTAITGILTHISPGADPVTGLFSADIIIDNPDSKIPVGVFANAEVILSHKSDVLVIPRSALIQDSTVFVYSGGKVEKRIVKTGIVLYEKAEVIDGIKEGEIIVSQGALGLKDGMDVEAVEKERLQ
ncbi:MAG: hypothetical protein JXB42_11575, partial [Deltaproteobacteria bacterium]|nr:hypothetical protein [Deltaproteobacteria bacterium]